MLVAAREAVAAAVRSQHDQALKEFQLEFQIGHTRCGGARGSESEPPARAAAGLQDGAGSQATAAAPGFLPARGC